MSLEDTLKGLDAMIKEFNVNFKSHADKAEARAVAQDERIAVLEKSIREKLVSDHGPKDYPKNRWSWLRYCLAYATKDWSIAPFEKEECEKYRDMVTKGTATLQAGTFTVGGALIPANYSTELIELLRGDLIMSQLGVRTLTGLTGSPIIFPKLTSGMTGYWISEGTAPTVSDMGTAQLTLQPHKLGALAKISNDLLLLNNPSMEAAVRADIVAALREADEKAFFEGTGTLGQPLGLLNWTPAITELTYTTTSEEDEINSLIDMIRTVENAYALRGQLAFAMHPNAYWAIQKLVDANKRHYLQPDPAVPHKSVLFGYPVIRGPWVTTAAGSATEDQDNVYFGNWNDAIHAIWSNIDVSASLETNTAFQNDELWIRAFMRVDNAVRLEASFCRMDRVR